MTESAVSARLERLTVAQVTASGWPELFLRLPQPRCHQHPDWLLAADRHLLDQDLHIVCVHRGEQLALILPWQSTWQGRRAAAPVHDHLTLGDALFDPSLTSRQHQQCLQQALTAATDSPWQWHIGNVPDHSPLLRTTRGHPQWESRLARHSAWFELHPGDSPGSGKLKRNLRRLRRQLAEQGRLRAEWHDNAEALPDALRHFLTLEDAGWKGRRGMGTAIADTPHLQSFYEALLQPRFPGLQVVISLLWLDERCIGAQYGVITGNCLSLLKIAHDESCSHYSPGSLLLQDTADQARVRQLQTLSLVSCPTWAERWHPQREPVWHLSWFAPGPGGRALRSLAQLRQQARHRLKRAA